jgi:hypothetical protein
MPSKTKKTRAQGRDSRPRTAGVYGRQAVKQASEQISDFAVKAHQQWCHNTGRPQTRSDLEAFRAGSGAGLAFAEFFGSEIGDALDADIEAEGGTP